CRKGRYSRQQAERTVVQLVARNVQRLEILETAEGREVVVRHVNGVFNHRTGYHTRRFREYDSRFPQPFDGGAVVGRRRCWFSGAEGSGAKKQGDEQHRLERSIIDRHGIYLLSGVSFQPAISSPV